MFSKKVGGSKKWEEVRKSGQKVLDPKRDTPTRTKHLKLFLDHSESREIAVFLESHNSEVFFVLYDAFILAETNLRTKGPHKAQREELEAVLFLLENILVYLPELLGRKWQYHAITRLMSKLLHPGNSWKILKREAMRLFLLWYQSLADAAGEPLHALFATLVPGFPSPYPGMGLTALAALTPDTQEGPITPGEIAPLIPPQSGERGRSPDTDITRIFLDVLLELIVSQISLIEWKENKLEKRKKSLIFLLSKFKTFYMPHIFPDFNWSTSLYRPSLELPEVRKFTTALVDTGDGGKKIDPMLACRVVVIKWVAQYTHQTRNNQANTLTSNVGLYETGLEGSPGLSNFSGSGASFERTLDQQSSSFEESNLVREILYGDRDNVNFVHEVYRQAFLLSFRHSPAIKKVISVYKDWIQMNVPELPPFLLEPIHPDRDDYKKALLNGESDSTDGSREPTCVRAGLQNVLQIFVTNAANVFLLEVSAEDPIFLDEQVEMCKRVLNIYRYMVMNVKMEARTWEQLLFILLQITQLTLPETPPRKRDDFLGGRLAQAIFQTLIVTWIKANLYVVVSTELWDQFLEVLSSLTLWEELFREWSKTMETLTRVLARQVYNLDLNDLPLDRLSERAAKKKRGKQGGNHEMKYSHELKLSSTSTPQIPLASSSNLHPYYSENENYVSLSSSSNRISPGSRKRIDSSSSYNNSLGSSNATTRTNDHSNNMKSKTSGRRKRMYRSMSEGNIVRSDYNNIDDEIDGITKTFSSYFSKRRSKSVDFGIIRTSEPWGSRSSSPAPSSSINDSPMQFDPETMSDGGLSDLIGHHGSNSGGDNEPRSVMSGGSVKGWLPDVAVVLWRRMLGALGNINQIADTVIHAQIYKYLIELYEVIVKIRNNQGVTLDNMSTPPCPEYVPPVTIFTPWCFRALSLPDTYQRGRIYALRLLCLMTIRPHDNPLPKTHLIQFYKLLHQGLTQNKMDIMNILIKFTGPRFFSLMLPGYTAYILDYLYATNHIISTSELKGVPRTEATSIVGSLLAFPPIVRDIPVLLPNSNELSLISSADIKDQIVGILLKSGRKEPAGLARCISLSSLGIFVYTELIHKSFHPKIKEAIQVLLTALRFNNKSVAQIASDMLLLLTDHVQSLLDYYPEVPKKIVEVLARTLTGLAPKKDSEDEKRLLMSLLFCLGEWTMKIPQQMLSQTQEDGQSLAYLVFNALQSAALSGCVSITPSPVGPTENNTRREGKNFEAFPQVFNDRSGTISSGMLGDFDPNIHVDNTKEGYTSTNSSPQKSVSQPKSEHHLSRNNLEPLPLFSQNLSIMDSKCPVRLASNAIIAHLLNHVYHFPMGTGAANLSCLISEHDDVPGYVGDELSMEAFTSPNIQLFVLNDSTLVSLIELPVVMDDDPAFPGIQTGNSQVRIILRDLSGKFSWDSSILYGPPDGLNKSMEDITSHPEFWSSCDSSFFLNKKRPCQPLRQRRASILPIYSNTADDMDNLDDLLSYLTYTSPEVMEEIGKPINTVSQSHFFDCVVEKDIISTVLNQRTSERDYTSNYGKNLLRPVSPPDPIGGEPKFQFCRSIFNQMGWSSWEKRPHIHLMKKTERLIRELKNLDNIRGRETHKIAIIYVAAGQEDKHSILDNSSGSQAYEEFISGLAWEVELESHTGFMAGLKKNKSTGETSPYYATSFIEVMFHVATRMPSCTEESLLQKTRHLGNDEIHIVWSEHYRDYRRGILPTEFCDVLIIIYPLPNKLFRIQISRKLEVPFFGPLFNESIVDGKALPGLVRATAINASRAKRSMIPYFQSHYEERAKALEDIIKNHKESTTYEEFITKVYSPQTLQNLFQPNNPVRSSLTLQELRPRSKTEIQINRYSSVSETDPLYQNGTSPKNMKKMSFKNVTGKVKTSVIKEENDDIFHYAKKK
ncbi:ral GTPase-activating protein subunit alpha-1 [Lepeophtheirus salmonis]|uniref:Putative Rho GTPaseactivating protein CG5521like [Apis florea] n=1 Tax=Lepeophtheirus salmonis TaxID=72036 RepID=A0A0K2TAY1_LEPSM|nr:ral GTPase-activating protein subunit alpha-1-like [Lepeophtheirus salmonis]